MTQSRGFYFVPEQLLSCRVVAISNQSGSYQNGSAGVGATLTIAASSLTVDGVVLVEGDRILLSGQTSANQNGIYVVSSIGSSVVLTRSADLQSIEQLKAGLYCSIQAGTDGAGAIYVLAEPLPIEFGVNDLVFYSTNRSAGGEFLQAANNLSDVDSVPDAKDNLGIKRGTTAAYAGGGTSNAFTATGIAATDIVTASLLSRTNAVSISQVVPTADTLTVTFSADPGANTVVNWIAVSP